MKHRLLIASVLLLAGGRAAEAAPCNLLPDPIYVAGSSAVGPLIKSMGKALAPTTTLIYQKQGSCTGVNAIVDDTTPAGACATGACITGTATFYDATGTAQTCDLDAAGTHVDVGVSDVYGTTCTGAALPANVSDNQGPVQTMVFIVPEASTQTAIWAEEAYFVFGFGTNGGVTPWVDETLLMVRNALSGTQQMVAYAIGVPAARWKGVDKGGSQAVLDGVSQSTSADATVGIISSDFYDAHRDVVNALAYQAYGQYAAYYPDSTATAVDKQNVRDGHYVIWGYFHMLGHTPLSSAAQRFVDWVQNVPTTPPAPFNSLQTEIQDAHMIPKCAMQVSRSTETGDLSEYTDPAPCECYYESLVSTTACTACDDNNPCSTGTCRDGYCEAQ